MPRINNTRYGTVLLHLLFSVAFYHIAFKVKEIKINIFGLLEYVNNNHCLQFKMNDSSSFILALNLTLKSSEAKVSSVLLHLLVAFRLLMLMHLFLLFYI